MPTKPVKLMVKFKCVGCRARYELDPEVLRSNNVDAPCCGLDTGGGGCGSPLVAVSARTR